MNKIIFLIAFAAVLAQPVIAQAIVTQSYVNVNVNFLRSDPVIPQPGENVDLYFSVNNVTSNQNPTQLQFQLTPTYPLTLAGGESGIRSFANVLGPSSVMPIVLQFHLYVAPNATKGTYNAELRYSSSNWASYNSITQGISVQNVATDFDVVEQDVSGDTVTFGLSNIGSNTANAVTFTIPSQDGFATQGVNSNIIGNLNAGDFTLVSFTLKQTGASNSLLTKVFYTDTTGTRREVDKTVDISFAAPPTTTQSTNRTSPVTYVYYIVIAAAFLAGGYYLGKRRRK
ncbi:hypothetical protein EPN87_00385 [archaeon]|nr:MAG: hypothetical protein EPN87_00385 [archaeon]